MSDTFRTWSRDADVERRIRSLGAKMPWDELPVVDGGFLLSVDDGDPLPNRGPDAAGATLVLSQDPSAERIRELRRWGADAIVPSLDPDAKTLLMALWEAADRAQLRGEISRLRREKDLTAAFVRSARDAMLLIRVSDERIADANEAASQLYGYTREELCAMKVSELRDPSERHLVPRQLLLASEEGVLFQTRHVRKDGSEIHVEVSARGEVFHGEKLVFSVVRDVGARYESQEALARSELRLRRVLDNLFAFVGQLDREGNLLMANAAPLELAGLAAEDVVGKPFWDCYWWTFDEGVRERIRQACLACAQGQTVRYDVPVRLAEERRVIIDFQLAPLYDAEGRVEGMVPSGVDVTDRTRMTRELADSSERYHRATHGGRVGVWDWEIQENRLAWCDMNKELFGVPAEEFDGSIQSFWDSIHPDDIPKVEAAIGQSLEKDSPYELTARVIRRTDGALRYLALRAEILRDEQGRAVRMVGTASDVTDQTRAELALAHSEELFRLVSDASGAMVYEFELPSGHARSMHGIRRLTGVSPEESRQTLHWWLSLIHPDDVPTVVPHIEEIRQKGERRSYSFEYRIRSARGSWLHVQDNGIFLPETDERAARLIGGVVDQTQRIQIEEALRDSEERLRLALKNVPLSLLYLDKDLRFTYVVNPPIGSSVAQYLGKTDSDVFGPENAAKLASVKRRVLETGQPEEREIWLDLPDGPRCLLAYIEPRFDAAGNVVGLVDAAFDITKLRLTEREASRVSAVLEAVNRTTSTLIFVKDREGRMMVANPAVAELAGLPLEELIGKTDVEFWPEAEARVVMENDRRVMDTGEVLVVEEASPDGRVFLSTKSPYRDESGEVVGIIGVGLDITDRKRVEEALRESEARFRTMADAAPVLIWVADVSKDCTYFNKGWLDFTGRTFEEEYGVGWASGVHPDDRERCWSVYSESFDARQPFEMEYRLRRRDGEWRWLLDNGTPRFAPDGEFVGFIGSCIDVTDRRAAIDALRQSEERLRLAVTSWEMGTWEFDPTTGEYRADATHYKLFGLPYAEGPMNVDEFWQLLHPEDRERMQRERPNYEVGQKEWQWEYRIMRADDGAVRWLASRSRAVFHTDGTLSRVIGLNFDITDSKNAEAERQVLLEAERAARAEAERQSRLKDEFLATLSHELRTPMNAVLGWSELLKTRRSPDTLEKGLEVIDRNARNQAQLIDDLLDMSRLSSGKIQLDLRETDLANVVEDALDAVRHAADAKGVRISVDLEPAAGHVRADPNRIQQVVWNLLSNAIKFTPSDGSVSVRLQRLDSAVQIVVEDTGQGIDPAFLPYVFERFSQADASTTRRHGGLGLGLSIVRQLVELHGGSVRASSEGEGRGSRFVVTMPTGFSVASRVDTEPSQKEDAKWASLDLDGLELLVVDDEPDALDLVRRLLEECRAVVRTARSSAEASEALKDWQPDVVVSDISMPGEDGYTFLRRLRRGEFGCDPQTPAVAITAFARPEDRTRSLLAGYQMHLSKPIEPNELLAALASLTRRIGHSGDER